MAQTFSRTFLSGDAYGAGILVPYQTSISAAASTIHAPGINELQTDEVWLYAVNTSAASDATITFNWGYVEGITTGSEIKATLGRGKGLTLVVPGLLFRGRSSNHVIKAYCSLSTAVVVHGYVNRVINS